AVSRTWDRRKTLGAPWRRRVERHVDGAGWALRHGGLPALALCERQGAKGRRCRAIPVQERKEGVRRQTASSFYHNNLESFPTMFHVPQRAGAVGYARHRLR